MNASERIDAHQHVWRLSRGDYDWIAQGGATLAPLARDFSVDDYAPTMAAAGLTRTVLVQAAPTVAETQFLLDVASRDPRVAGVVGWCDLAAPDAADHIAGLQRDPLLKSVRPMLQDLPDDDWIATRPRPQAISAMIEAGLAFDALVLPRHLKALRLFAERWPELRIVIDHAAKPRLNEGWDGAWRAAWQADLAALAARPRTFCKLSGLLTEAPAEAGRSVEAAERALAPVFETVLAHFGPDRTMWGSDWPVLTLAVAPSVWIEATERLLQPLSSAERASVLAGAAARFYRLDMNSSPAAPEAA
jgi:L-fuconolactonase